MTINYIDFSTLWGVAIESTDRDMYISEWSTSSIFYPDHDTDGLDRPRVADALGNIWDVAHMSFAEMRKSAGMTQAQFSKLLCIPLRTMQNWEYRSGQCPDYYRLMISDFLGILQVKRDR